MKQLKWYSVICIFAVSLAACSLQRNNSSKSKEMVRLVKMMNGFFNSAAQAKEDSAFFDISLQMRSIWKERSGQWIYVEQAVSSNLSKPYRQRVYLLEQTGEKTYKSAVYTLKAPEKWLGKGNAPEELDSFSEKDIELKSGCEVILERQRDGSYTGGTVGTACESNLRGAAYATSKVLVNDKLLESWDQGFNAEGKQVWGATKGPYRFVKQQRQSPTEAVLSK